MPDLRLCGLLQVFVEGDSTSNNDTSLPRSFRETVPSSGSGRKCGFEQRDLVHLVGLVCPDFPEETIAWVGAKTTV